MNSPSFRSRSLDKLPYLVTAIACLALGLAVSPGTLAQTQPAAESAVATTTTDAATPSETPIPEAELDSLVAPIALYPDPLLSQTLVASTYPVELIQLQQWLAKNKGLKDKALADAVAKQPWDASIQGLVAFPEVVETLAGNIQWTSDLGNAFLEQQTDVMAAVQRMRAKAQGTGTLKTSEQQKVETETVEGGQQAIVIQPADPAVVYVPSYDPSVVYGAPAYPYPPVTYPGYVPGAGLAFGAGLALGAAWGGGWGYNCGWGSGDVNVNYNNTYNKQSVKGGQGSGNWQHNPQHRGNAPYGNRQTANKFGGTARGAGGAGGAGRPDGAGRVGGVGGAGRPGGAGGPGGVGGAGGAGGSGKPGNAARPGGAGGAGARPGGGAGTMAASKPYGGGGGGASSIGGHKPSAGGGGAFGGGSGPSAKAASGRGGASMGGGGGRGGGGGGGGRR
jgi:hypothetical protein